MHPAPAAVPPPSSDPVRELVLAQRDRLRRFVGRHVGHGSVAEDITQQAFAEMSLAYDRFRGESKPSTWLYGIALNLIRNHLARSPERRYAFVDIDMLASEPCPDPDPVDRARWRQKVGLVDQAMAEIPEDLRTLLHLIAVDDLSYEEAARQLDLPIGTVRSRLSRARAQLRLRLRAHGAGLDS
ncbi:RNA polymerase sigma factor [Achromobacter spanius]|uniref:RNA polymerase sigma factor n=1 Tax=Achromobacter spanius TaxID=217203 RepID=UPI003207BA60